MSDARPVVGITTGLHQAQWGVWDRVAALLPMEYVTAIQRAGGLALLIPPDPSLDQDADELLELLDGLILPGGSDIDPSAYGAPAHPHTNGTVPARDRTEIAVARGAIDRDMPLLGICRGMQLINVVLGGTLEQHLPDLVGHERHRPTPGTFDGSEHDVRLKAGSLAALAAGETLHGTNSHHHQGVERIGDGLEVTGRSVLDELPEAIEAPGCRFLLGVQWHPEADERSRVIDALVARARDYRGARLPA